MNVKVRSISVSLFVCGSLYLAAVLPLMAQRATPSRLVGVSLESLSPGKLVNGFRTVAIYADDRDKPMGARFVHARTGFTLDVLQIQSVPQGFIYANSFPSSDMGEPHTQEHLLLGKGSVGRSVSSAETMSLVGSNAFTQQLRTSYNFNTPSSEVFYDHFEMQMNALLHPNYTDEEIRREVRNFGVTENPADKTLRLEEKGSVYNEMSSSFSRAGSRMFHAAGLLLYGKNHPLSYSSGGTPEAIRNLKPQDIRSFHAANYHLGNMGMIGSFPKDMPIGEILKRTDAILNRLQPRPSKLKFKTKAGLAAPKMATAGKIEIVEYPNKNDQQPGNLVFVWPATLKISDPERVLLELFLDNIASDPTTNLYKKFVDTKTREMDLGAKGVFNFVSEEMGYPIYLGLTEVTPANMNEPKIGEVRQKIMAEIGRVAALPDGSPDLAEFNTRLKNRVTETRRALAKFVNSPPGFGFRGTGSGWMDQLDRINETPGFRKSVTMKPGMAFVDQQLTSNQNFWRGYIDKWKLATTTPYGLAAKPNAELLKQDEQERLARSNAEVARLKAKYKASDNQEAIRRYQAEYDAASAELDRLAKEGARTRFIDAPPMTLDDQLDFKTTATAKGVPHVASTFDNMTSATTGIALKMGSVPEDELFYLSMMPALLTRVGVIKDGKAITFEEMSELLKKEILSLNSNFSINARTGRAELVVRAAGNDTAESIRAVEWMKLVLYHPNWKTENLARIRDVVDQSLGTLRNTMQGSEESWVNDPSGAYRRQDSPLYLTVGSFLTRSHNVHRLRWRLKDPGTGTGREAISEFLKKLAEAGNGAKREELKFLLAAIQGTPGAAEKMPDGLKTYWTAFELLPGAPAKALALDVAKDLDQILNDIPDSSLGSDWAYVAKQIREDLLVPPDKTLSELDKVRQRLLKTGNARVFVIGSQDTQRQLAAGIESLTDGLDHAMYSAADYSKLGLIDERLRERAKVSDKPVFVGLINPSSQSGVMMNSAPLVTYQDLNRESLLQYLASKLYAGGGAHGIFTKTIGAGLAYSNGLGGSPTGGRTSYYAERTPELPQTLRFVIDELKKAPRDPELAEYAIAQAFGEFRSASGYEARGESMAADVADGLKPEQVRAFRQAVLDLRKTPNLYDEIYTRMGKVYAKVLPGYDATLKTVPGAVYFVVGPEKQFAAYEAYLKSTLGPDTRLDRLYPRDFWMPIKN